MLEQFLSTCAIDLKKLISSLHSPIYLFIFFFNAIKLVCAHFPWNNLSLLLIEKYFLGPVLFLKFNFFFLEHDKFKIFWILWKMIFKRNVSLVYCNVSCWQFNLSFQFFHPFSFLLFFLSKSLFWEKKLLQIFICQWFILWNLKGYSGQQN